MIPLVHDFRGETVLVFGGGSVGLRKARRFAREARVVVVGTEFADESVGASLVRARVEPRDVEGWLDRAAPALVVAATDDAELNEAVETAARERGVLVNRADEAGGRDAGSVVVPATARDGDVVVAVSTGGRSPALSKHLRERIEPLLDGADAVAALTADLRAELKARGAPRAERRTALRAVVESDAVRDAVENENGEDEGAGREAANAVVRDVLNRG